MNPLPQPPFPIPSAPKPITSAARVPVIGDKVPDVRSPVLLSGGLYLSKCSVSEWDDAQ